MALPLSSTARHVEAKPPVRREGVLGRSPGAQAWARPSWDASARKKTTRASMSCFHHEYRSALPATFCTCPRDSLGIDKPGSWDRRASSAVIFA